MDITGEGEGGGMTSHVYDGLMDIQVRVVPEPGMVLLFDHRIYHDGETVTEGLKYTVRVRQNRMHASIRAAPVPLSHVYEDMLQLSYMSGPS